MDQKRLLELAGIQLNEGFGGMNASQARQELAKNRREIMKLTRRNEQLETIIQKTKDSYGK